MLRTPLKDIGISEIDQVMSDLFQIRRWSKQDYADYLLYEILQLLMIGNAAEMSTKYLPLDSALDLKIKNIHGNSFYEVCRELKGGQTLEEFDEVTLIAFLKDHFSGFRSLKRSKTEPTEHDRTVALIKQRRENGTL